jgi:hypothetical protein
MTTPKTDQRSPERRARRSDRCGTRVAAPGIISRRMCGAGRGSPGPAQAPSGDRGRCGEWLGASTRSRSEIAGTLARHHCGV